MAKVYRVIEYDGSDEWLRATLERSVHGTFHTGAGKITSAVVRTLASWQHEALEEARRHMWVPGDLLKGGVEYEGQDDQEGD